jgi:hypothetical protein
MLSFLYHRTKILSSRPSSKKGSFAMNPPKYKSIEPKKPAARKRGGQPGNSNAFKHGFYTKNFSPAECRGLQSTQGVVLGDEIALLRVLINRLI